MDEKEKGDALRKAFTLLKQTQTKLEQLQREQSEPIAIIGMGCRFPGGANNPDQFWNLLSQGYDGVSEVPKERWDIDAYYDPDPDAPGKMYIRSAGFLNTPIDQFDAQFFGISPREAGVMDPQQRMLLEITWEALENAGIGPQQLVDTHTGVFIGAAGEGDFQRIAKKSEGLFKQQLGNCSALLQGDYLMFLD